jgi:propionyl-CoA carboxylase alpha chain
MQLAVSEALNAFGDGSVFIERYVTQPRHIEIQVLADAHGHVVHLFERECSIQRRHQKVIEEAPSALLSPELRQRMGEAAVNVCRACGYVNAGTVEFLVDAQGQFYFLEMNTRLQVEHPVTELITGLDLVEQQLRIAQGEPLAFSQDDLRIKGHAIEIRVCAEDPRNNFLPDTGTLHVYRPPRGKGIRLDGGYTEGMEVSVYYDPLLAKLIVHGPNRPAAIRRLIEAIDGFVVVGVETTLPFCRYVLEHRAFVSGQFDTGFVQAHFQPEALAEPPSDPEAAALLGAAIWQAVAEAGDDPQRIAERRNITAWELRHGW